MSILRGLRRTTNLAAWANGVSVVPQPPFLSRWGCATHAVDLTPATATKITTEPPRELSPLTSSTETISFPDGVVVGHVISCERHPNADRLRVCTVDIGAEENLTIVCGAPNVTAGLKVPVAKVGTRIQGKKLKKSKLRGVASVGMICSEDELSLKDERMDGIMILRDEATVGSQLSQQFFQSA